MCTYTVKTGVKHVNCCMCAWYCQKCVFNSMYFWNITDIHTSFFVCALTCTMYVHTSHLQIRQQLLLLCSTYTSCQHHKTTSALDRAYCNSTLMLDIRHVASSTGLNSWHNQATPNLHRHIIPKYLTASYSLEEGNQNNEKLCTCSDSKLQRILKQRRVSHIHVCICICIVHAYTMYIYIVYYTCIYLWPGW